MGRPYSRTNFWGDIEHYDGNGHKIGESRSIERLKEEGFEYRYFNDDVNYGFWGKECIETM